MFTLKDAAEEIKSRQAGRTVKMKTNMSDG